MVELGRSCFPLPSFLRLRFAAGAHSFNPSVSPGPLGRGLNPAGAQTEALPPLSVKLVPSQASCDTPNPAGTARGARCWFQAPGAPLKTRVSCFGVYNDSSKSRSALTLPP